MSEKNKMSSKDAQRIQSSQDSKGNAGDKGFVSRAMQSAHKNASSQKSEPKKK